MQQSWWPDDASWEAAKKRFQPGETVKGVVVIHAIFGYFVDIGEPFLAFVDLGAIKDKRRPFPACGTTITGTVFDFRDEGRQMRIIPTQ
jgi:ribosomal protein S1